MATSKQPQPLVILFEQGSHLEEKPLDYYTPCRMLSTDCFCLRPLHEMLCIIRGARFGYLDDAVYALSFSTDPRVSYFTVDQPEQIGRAHV